MDPHPLSVLAGSHAVRCIPLSPGAQQSGYITTPKSCPSILKGRKKPLTAPLRACVRRGTELGCRTTPHTPPKPIRVAHARLPPVFLHLIPIPLGAGYRPLRP